MSLKKIEKKIKQHKKNKEKDFLSPFFKKFLLIISGVSFVVIVLVGIFIWNYLNHGGQPEIMVSVPQDVSRGGPFDLDIGISNTSDLVLQNSSLNIYLDDGLVFWGTPHENILTDNIGNISPGNLLKKHYKIIPVGSLNSSSKINISLVYFNNKGSRFEIKKDFTVVITSSAFNLSVTSPQNPPSGSLFSFTLNYTNNSGYDFSNLYLIMDAPDGFELRSASFPFSKLSKKFTLGPSLSGQTEKINISGIFTDQSSNSFNIPFKLFLVINGKDYNVADYVANFNLSQPSVGINILVNGSSNYLAKSNDHLVYTILYQNLGQTAIKDATVQVVLSGFVDWNSIKTNGKYNQEKRTITWDSTVDHHLSLIEPSFSGVLSFELNIAGSVPTSLNALSNKNLYVKADVSLLNSSDNGSLSTVAETVEEVKVGSLVYFNVNAFLNDPNFPSKGPFPPRADIPTTYSVHWYVTNFGNDLSYVKIQAPLPPNVKFIGNGQSNLPLSVPVYDADTKSVVWDIGDVFAGSGFLNGPLEGSFQLEVTPTSYDVGSFVTILGQSNFQALDNFTKTNILLTKDKITSGNLFDLGGKSGIVLP